MDRVEYGPGQEKPIAKGAIERGRSRGGGRKGRSEGALERLAESTIAESLQVLFQAPGVEHLALLANLGEQPFLPGHGFVESADRGQCQGQGFFVLGLGQGAHQVGGHAQGTRAVAQGFVRSGGPQPRLQVGQLGGSR